MHGPRQKISEWQFGPEQKSCRVTCGWNCKALMLRMHRDQQRHAIIYDNAAQDKEL